MPPTARGGRGGMGRCGKDLNQNGGKEFDAMEKETRDKILIGLASLLNTVANTKGKFMTEKVFVCLVASVGLCINLFPPQAFAGEDTAQEKKTETSAQAKPEDTHGLLQGLFNGTSVGTWLDKQRITVSGHVEQGVMGNFDAPADRLNFGRLFDDRANDYFLNQAVLTLERPLSPEPGKFDWAFKFQFMYGSDARYIHSLGLLDNVTDKQIQPDFVELYVNFHMPWLTKNGMDVKLGKFVTLMGAEVIYAPANPLYSHSYIFNFGIPFNHTGFLVTTHLTDQLDLHTGLVRGINTSIDDNNDAVAFHGGISWKTKDEKVNLFGSVHVGAENSDQLTLPTGRNPNSALRVIGDIVATLKPTGKLTLITDLDYGQDDGFDAQWYGIAQYGIYQCTDWLSFVVRGEVFRDDDGFAVAAFGSSDDFINLERSGTTLSSLTRGGGDTTYTALTVGLNITPHKTLVLRPEVRWDWAGGGNQPFDNTSKSHQFTIGLDVIWKF